VAVATVA